MMVAVSANEVMVSFYKTMWRNNPEESHLHTPRGDNRKTHSANILHIRYLLVFTVDTGDL
jgi:hypothetical protein